MVEKFRLNLTLTRLIQTWKQRKLFQPARKSYFAKNDNFEAIICTNGVILNLRKTSLKLQTAALKISKNAFRKYRDFYYLVCFLK